MLEAIHTFLMNAGQFIEMFQTLIAGIIAIGAAFIGAEAIYKQTAAHEELTKAQTTEAMRSALQMVRVEIQGMTTSINVRAKALKILDNKILEAGSKFTDQTPNLARVLDSRILTPLANDLSRAPQEITEQILKFYNAVEEFNAVSDTCKLFKTAISSLLPLVPRVTFYGYLAENCINHYLLQEFQIDNQRQISIRPEILADAAVRADYDLEEVARSQGHDVPPQLLRAIQAARQMKAMGKNRNVQ